jgi:hypothetical protein
MRFAMKYSPYVHHTNMEMEILSNKESWSKVHEFFRVIR